VTVATASTRQRWDTEVFSLVPEPGFPAHVHAHPNGRVYAGTYTDPRGDARPSRVFEWSGTGTLLRSWTVPGQDLSAPHGVQVAASDGGGRLVLLEKSTATALLLDPRDGSFTEYAALPRASSVPNFAAWGPDGSLFVTDYGEPVLWRVPPGGGRPVAWLEDRRLDGGELGTTGLALRADRSSLLVAQQSSLGLGELNPTTGKLYVVPIRSDGGPGEMRMLWESGPGELPDGFGIAASGRIYVANAGPSHQIVVLDSGGRELGRFPELPATGANSSAVPFDTPSCATFAGTSILVANQSYRGERDHHAILDVAVGEPGLPVHIPADAGSS